MPNASNYIELSRQFVEISLLDVAQAVAAVPLMDKPL